MMAALLLASLLQEKRAFGDSLALVRKEALAWNAGAALLKVAYKGELLFDVNPQADRGCEIEFQFGGREGLAPGEMKVRSWTLGPADAAPRAGEEKTVRNSPPPLPEKLAPVKAAVEACTAQGMKLGPKMELSVLHGRPLWATTNGGQKFWFADGTTGQFAYFCDGAYLPANFVRDQTTAITTWKQAVDAIEKDLRAWKAAGPQVSTIRATGKTRAYLDPEMGLVDWDIQVYLDKPAPVMLLYRISNGAVVQWAQDAVPADKSHFAPLSSWSLQGAGQKMLEHAAVKPFLASLPRVTTELLIDAPRMKSGEASFRIASLEDRSVLEVTLDRKGAVKGAKK